MERIEESFFAFSLWENIINYIFQLEKEMLVEAGEAAELTIFSSNLRTLQHHFLNKKDTPVLKFSNLKHTAVMIKLCSSRLLNVSNIAVVPGKRCFLPPTRNFIIISPKFPQPRNSDYATFVSRYALSRPWMI